MSGERWLTASLVWVAAGFLFPFLTPATALSSVVASALAASIGVLGEFAR